MPTVFRKKNFYIIHQKINYLKINRWCQYLRRSQKVLNPQRWTSYCQKKRVIGWQFAHWNHTIFCSISQNNIILCSIKNLIPESFLSFFVQWQKLKTHLPKSYSAWIWIKFWPSVYFCTQNLQPNVLTFPWNFLQNGSSLMQYLHKFLEFKENFFFFFGFVS